MPGSVEFDGDGNAVKYGPNADDPNGESTLKEGEKCFGFPFNPHRE
jgi:hypothetical protein